MSVSLESSDHGSPPLTRYRRVVVTVGRRRDKQWPCQGGATIEEAP